MSNADNSLTPRQMWLRLSVALLVGMALWFTPPPAGAIDAAGAYVADAARAGDGARSLATGFRVFAVFAGSIVAFLLRPLPMGAVTIIALVLLCVTGTLTLSQALMGYADDTVWLVVAAFLLAGTMLETGLGRRIALHLVVKMGRSPRGLGHAICASELVLGAVIPSNTARGGGVLFPITRSLAEALDSRPEHHPQRIGAFLMTVGAQANLIAAAMYLTGMAANPLVRVAAADVFGIDFGWGTWALGAIVPALVAFAALVEIAHRLEPPTVADVAQARRRAQDELGALGPMSRDELVMAAIGFLLVALWSTTALHGLPSTLVAWIGIACLLLSRVASWRGVVRNDGAWDALIWVGGILTMANHLREAGFIAWFAHGVGQAVASLSGLAVIVALALVYFYSMYAFSMLTAHIAAMVAAFLAIAKAAHAPAMVAVALLAYFSCLCACLTPYSSGPVIIHFGAGYVSSQRWFRNGFLISLMHLFIWIPVGLLWWRVLGWW